MREKVENVVHLREAARLGVPRPDVAIAGCGAGEAPAGGAAEGRRYAGQGAPDLRGFLATIRTYGCGSKIGSTNFGNLFLTHIHMFILNGTLVNGNMDISTCSPIPGGFILTHNHMGYAWFGGYCRFGGCKGNEGSPKSRHTHIQQVPRASCVLLILKNGPINIYIYIYVYIYVYI